MRRRRAAERYGIGRALRGGRRGGGDGRAGGGGSGGGGRTRLSGAHVDLARREDGHVLDLVPVHVLEQHGVHAAGPARAGAALQTGVLRRPVSSGEESGGWCYATGAQKIGTASIAMKYLIE